MRKCRTPYKNDTIPLCLPKNKKWSSPLNAVIEKDAPKEPDPKHRARELGLVAITLFAEFLAVIFGAYWLAILAAALMCRAIILYTDAWLEVNFTKTKRRLIEFCLCILCIFFFVFAPYFAKQKWAKDHPEQTQIVRFEKPAPPPQPELEMYFVGPRFLEWRIKNDSSFVVEHAKYWFGLVDLDQPYLNPGPNLSGTVTKYQPLQLPVKEVDYINAGDFAGALLFPDDLRLKIKKGDRIWGMADLTCPNCKEKGYWIFFNSGISGWYSEIKGASLRGLEMPIPVENTETELEKLVPTAQRIAILPERR